MENSESNRIELHSQLGLVLDKKSKKKIAFQGQISEYMGDDQEINKFNVKEILSTIFTNNFKKEQRNKILERKKQPMWMYIATLLATILTGTQNLYIFLWQSFTEKDKYIFFPTLILRPIMFILSSYYLSQNWKIIVKLYSSFDRILVAEIAMMISVGVFSNQFIPFTKDPWIYYSNYILYPLLLITFSGYFRIMMIFCKWEAWQTILIKISIAIGAGSYFGLGMYYTVVDGKFTDGQSQELDGVILNLILLFAFAGFDYHLEIFSIIDETDGTNQYNLTYQLKSNPQDIECLIGKKKKKAIKPVLQDNENQGTQENKTGKQINKIQNYRENDF